ncbi:MAG: hypothetical protein ABFD79_16100 [Phycisphaerales bacterium]
MTKKLFYISFLILAVCSLHSYAVNYYWVGLGSDNLWTTGPNWDADQPPYTGDLAVIDKPDAAGTDPNCTYAAGMTETIGGCWVGFSQRPCYMDMSGGSLTTTDGGLGLRLGVDNGTGTLRMSGGDITVNGDMAVGQGANGEGTLEMTGGTITVTGSSWLYVGYSGSKGKIDLKGGTIRSFSMAMDDNGSQNVNLSDDGQLIIRDPRPSEIEYQVISFYAPRGWITSYDGNGTFDIAVGPNQETIVTAVPPVCWPIPKADLTGDCKVNFEDMAVVASEWLTCNLTDGSCWQ